MDPYYSLREAPDAPSKSDAFCSGCGLPLVTCLLLCKDQSYLVNYSELSTSSICRLSLSSSILRCFSFRRCSSHMQVLYQSMSALLRPVMLLFILVSWASSQLRPDCCSSSLMCCSAAIVSRRHSSLASPSSWSSTTDAKSFGMGRAYVVYGGRSAGSSHADRRQIRLLHARLSRKCDPRLDHLRYRYRP